MSLYLHLTFKWFSKINLCGTHTQHLEGKRMNKQVREIKQMWQKVNYRYFVIPTSGIKSFKK